MVKTINCGGATLVYGFHISIECAEGLHFSAFHYLKLLTSIHVIQGPLNSTLAGGMTSPLLNCLATCNQGDSYVRVIGPIRRQTEVRRGRVSAGG